MTIIVGLTGGIASGKSTVSNCLSNLGAFIVDADIIARDVVSAYSPVTKKIEALLGNEYILDNGALNRSKIKQLIFNQPAIKQQYEAIVLPAIKESLLAKLANIPDSSPYCVCVVPLLFEKGFDEFVDYTVCVDISEELQIIRACKRNPQDDEVIKQIIATQIKRQERVMRSDYVIDNMKGKEQLYQQIETLHKLFSNLSANKTAKIKQIQRD